MFYGHVSSSLRLVRQEVIEKAKNCLKSKLSDHDYRRVVKAF